MPWINRWDQTLWHPPARPGIWRRRAGGFVISTQIRDPKGRRVTAQKTCPDLRTVDEAQRELDQLRNDRRDDLSGHKRSRMLFAKFAASAFAHKVEAKDIRSAKGVEKWRVALEKHIVPRFGHLPCSYLEHAHVAAWRDELAKAIAASPKVQIDVEGKPKWVRNPKFYSPRTVNGWFSILRVLTARMCHQFKDLDRDPCTGLENFGLLEHPTYTDEKPNALTEKEARAFMAEMRASYPQHYAMTVLGFATGLRPSTLRPLRRKGPEADVDFERAVLRIRRSNSLGADVMGSTKTGKHQTIHMPLALVAILREQAAQVAALELADQPKSDLLFPSLTGGFRSRSSLDKPFAAVSKTIKLSHPITPRAMRRTFQDLMRLAGVDAVVTRSISGHATDRMQTHYSTAQVEEQRTSLAKVIRLVS